jgi:hypothetical protein
MRVMENLAGKKFHRLTVLSHHERRGYAHVWKCLCDCGNETISYGAALRNGQTKSCGCWSKEQRSKATKTHGMTGTRIYNTWLQMRRRCHDPKDPAYPGYGGRGIDVCPEWMNSFESFFRDMGHRPNGMTLDRRNNDLGYCRDNCRWSSHKEQANNRRSSRVLEAFGEKMTVSQWAEKTGISSRAIRQRLDYYGYTVVEALTP